jgi:hypothetical protein
MTRSDKTINIYINEWKITVENSLRNTIIWSIVNNIYPMDYHLI